MTMLQFVPRQLERKAKRQQMKIYRPNAKKNIKAKSKRKTKEKEEFDALPKEESDPLPKKEEEFEAVEKDSWMNTYFCSEELANDDFEKYIQSLPTQEFSKMFDKLFFQTLNMLKRCYK